MSQRAVMIRVDGNLHKEIFSHVPDYDEAVQICRDFGYEVSDEGAYNYLSVEYELLEIGSGESDTDYYMDDETLCFLYDSYDFEKMVEEQFNAEVDVIEFGTIDVFYEDL